MLSCTTCGENYTIVCETPILLRKDNALFGISSIADVEKMDLLRDGVVGLHVYCQLPVIHIMLNWQRYVQLKEPGA